MAMMSTMSRVFKSPSTMGTSYRGSTMKRGPMGTTAMASPRRYAPDATAKESSIQVQSYYNQAGSRNVEEREANTMQPQFNKKMGAPALKGTPRTPTKRVDPKAGQRGLNSFQSMLAKNQAHRAKMPYGQKTLTAKDWNYGMKF